MNRSQKAIIGKVMNIIEDRRSAYLSGMADYMTITGNYDEGGFIIDLINYLNERNYKTETIIEFCKSWNN